MAPVILTPKREQPRQGWACLTCGDWFEQDRHREFERHTIACEQRNEHIGRDLSLRNRLGIFGGGMVIPDIEQWTRKHRRALIEGRMKL